MKDSLLKPVTAVFVLLICAISLARVSMSQTQNNESKTREVQKKSAQKTAASFRPYQDPSDLRAPFNWKNSSENRDYPKIKRHENDLSIRVSLMGNRVYILRDDKRIYTMLSSAGLFKNGESLTPTGTYKIQSDRGDSFYNPDLNEGGRNWLSWNKRKPYLFHSVPTKSDGQYNLTKATKLGVKSASHGCIWLSVPDSHWLMENIPVGTKVIIKNK